MSIGSNIKKLRRERDITQEQLAEYLHLTTSAISQWETNRVLPDVTQIPQLANIFRVSADVILGIDIDTKDERIDKICNKGLDLHASGHIAEAVELFRSGLHEFPDSLKLMKNLADSLWYIEFPENPDKHYPEIISLYEKVLEGSNDELTKNYVTGELCNLYTRTGRFEEAKKLAESIPVCTFTYDQCYLSTLRGAEWADEKRRQIDINFDKLLWDIRNLINGARRVITDDKPYFSDSEIIELYRKIIVFTETYYEKGDYCFNSELLSEVYYECALIHLKNGDFEKTLNSLEKAHHHIIESDTYSDGLHGSNVVFTKDKLHTSILPRPKNGVETMTGTVYKPCTKNNSWLYLESLSGENFNQIRNDPRFVKIMESLRTNAKAD